MSVPVPNPLLASTPRLRSVTPDDFARPGVYRLPAHVVSGLQPGAESGTPLVGYLVLLPVGVAPTLAPVPTPTLTPVSPAAPAVPSAEPAQDVEGLAIDPGLRTVRLDGEPLELTYLEFELLAHLAAHPHRVHTRDRLVEAVWGYSHIGDGRTVDVHVARLRRKLGPVHRRRIVTVRRVGYTYVPSDR